MDMYQKREMRKNKKIDENTKSLPSTSINWYPGHMKKSLEEIQKTFKLVDMTCIILDARAVSSSLNKNIYELVKIKPIIYIINKSDTAQTLDYSSIKEFVTSKDKVVFCSTVTGEGIPDIIKAINVLGKEKYQNKAMQNPVYKVMVSGIPNVGKSSIINKLCKNTSAKVGNKPGVTRSLQWLKVNPNIQMLDTPGLMMPKLEDKLVGTKLGIIGAINEDILDKEQLCYDFIKIIYENSDSMKLLETRYSLDVNNLEDISEDKYLNIIYNIGLKRGCLLKGEVDLSRTSELILNEYRTGKIGKISLD